MLVVESLLNGYHSTLETKGLEYLIFLGEACLSPWTHPGAGAAFGVHLGWGGTYGQLQGTQVGAEHAGWGLEPGCSMCWGVKLQERMWCSQPLTAMEAPDSVFTEAILSPELKVSPWPMAVGVQWEGGL